MSFYLGCGSCIHREGDSCKAFPDVIPQAIASGEIRHDQSLPGDGGISFWPTEEAAETILGLSLPQYLFDAARNQKRKESKSCGCCAKKKSIRQSDLWNDLPEITVPERIRRKASRDDAEREMERILEEEEEIGRSVDQVLRRQVDAVLKELNSSTAPTQELTTKIEEILRSSKWDRQLVEALRPYLLSSLENGIAVGVDAVKEVAKAAPDFWPSREELEAYTRSESVRLARGAARGVNRYTVVRFSEIIGTGVQDGKTIPEIASDVQKWAGEKGDAERATRSRALMIARTEAQRASRKAEVEAWKATGIVEGKVWLLAPDPCEFCEAASDAFSKNAIGLDQTFYQKGDLLFGTPDEEGNRREMLMDYEDIEGPPLHPNCRCSLQPQLVSDYRDIVEEGLAEIRGQGPFIEPEEETE